MNAGSSSGASEPNSKLSAATRFATCRTVATSAKLLHTSRSGSSVAGVEIGIDRLHARGDRALSGGLPGKLVHELVVRQFRHVVRKRPQMSVDVDGAIRAPEFGRLDGGRLEAKQSSGVAGQDRSL